MARDLMFQDEIRATVRDAYRALPTGAGRTVVDRWYDPAGLDGLPPVCVEWALGVGDPVSAAELAPGEVVVDLGCGAGIDAVLAARAVGETGEVIGVDLLGEMCERAASAARDAGVADRCRFEMGEMEALPLPDASVDVVVSNGALNLSPRKSRAIAEIVRVLRPGGRLCVADLVVEDRLPPAVMASDAAWAGCIAGALSERVLRNKLRRAGLEDIEVAIEGHLGLEELAVYPLFDEQTLTLLREVLPPRRQARVAQTVVIRGRRPDLAGHEAGPGTGGAGNGQPEVTASALIGSGSGHLTDIEPTVLEALGVSVRHLKTVEDIQLKVLEIAEGGATPRHVHPHAHEGLVIEGVGALELEHGDEPLEPGSVFSVAPGDRHRLANRGPRPFRLVCMDCFVD